jgi:hypothetical protein
MNKRFELKAQTYLAKEDDLKIKEIAEKHGIEIPNEDLAIFVTKYAALEEANLNGVRLSEEAVRKFIKSLNGKLADIDHIRPYVIGSILEGWINEETKEIEIAFTMYKSVFIEEYAKALELMSEGTLSVSFELTTNPETIEEYQDGTIRLHDINFSGVGLLLNTNPAYPKAQVYQMANRLLNKVKESNLVFACQIAEELGSDTIAEIENSTQKNLEEGGQENLMQLTEEQIKKIAELRAEFGDLAKDISDNDLLDEAKVAELRKPQETIEAQEVITTETNIVREEIRNEDETIIKIEEKVIDTIIDEEGEKTVNTVETTSVRTFTEIEMEEAVSPLRASVEELKEENELLKARIKELEDEKSAKELSEKIAAIKAELKDNPYVKDFTNEDYLDAIKIEKVKLLKERDDAKAEAEILRQQLATKQTVIATEEKPVLVTGHEVNQDKKEDKNEVKKIIRKIGKL